jgi:hypothetical protein
VPRAGPSAKHFKVYRECKMTVTCRQEKKP